MAGENPFDSGNTKEKVVDLKSKGTPIENVFKKSTEVTQKKGLKIGIWGPPSSGKTHFTFTAPTPINTIDTELGAASVANNFSGKEINISEIFDDPKAYLGESNFVEEEIFENNDVKCFEKIRQGVGYAYINQDKIGTLVIDSGSDLWSLCQSYAKVKVFKIKPEDRLKYQFDWGKINNIYMQVLNKLIAMKNPIIITGRPKEIYNQSGNPTGQYECGWQKLTQYMLDIIIESKVVTRNGESKFLFEIIKCRQNGRLKGKVFENLTYDKLKEEVEKREEKPKEGGNENAI